jgi:hypothetical protein
MHAAARVEERAMSSTLNDTMKTAIHGAESIREGTEHTLASTLAAVVKGVNAVSGVVAMLRTLDRDDGLAWFGLARRSPLRSAGMFGAGVAVGAGLGVLFAPTSGAEMRAGLLGRGKKQGARASAPPVAASPPEKDAAMPHEHDVGYGASHGYDPTHGGPTGPGDPPAYVTGSAPAGNGATHQQGST